MSDSKIHILTEEERKAISDRKKFDILWKENKLMPSTNSPYDLVNWALELKPEIFLDEKKEKNTNVEVEETPIVNEQKTEEDNVITENVEWDMLFNYEADYNDEDNSTSETQILEKNEEINSPIDKTWEQQNEEVVPELIPEEIIIKNKDIISPNEEAEKEVDELPMPIKTEEIITEPIQSINDEAIDQENVQIVPEIDEETQAIQDENQPIQSNETVVSESELDSTPEIITTSDETIADTTIIEENTTTPEIDTELEIQTLEQAQSDIVATETPEDKSLESQENIIKTEVIQEAEIQTDEQEIEENVVSEVPEVMSEQTIEQEKNINDEEPLIPEDIQQDLVPEESEFTEQTLPAKDSEAIYETNLDENTEIIDEKIPEDTIPEYTNEIDENVFVTPIPKTRKISVIVSPKTLDSLINTKQFKEELEEIFRKIVNNLDFEADEKHRLVRTKKVKELENVKSILMRVLSNQSITLDEKDLVEAFLEDVLNNDSFYRKEIIKALDSIELVYPLKLLGFSEKVSLIKDIIEWKEINSLIGTILWRIENLIVYKRFERKRIQKYYIEDEEGTKINKIITDFFNGRFTSITEIAYNIRNEIWNISEQKELFAKIAEKLTKFEPKYRKSLENTVITNQYTVESVFDVMVSYAYNIDTKIIYVESFNQLKTA